MNGSYRNDVYTRCGLNENHPMPMLQGITSDDIDKMSNDLHSLNMSASLKLEACSAESEKQMLTGLRKSKTQSISVLIH